MLNMAVAKPGASSASKTVDVTTMTRPSSSLCADQPPGNSSIVMGVSDIVKPQRYFVSSGSLGSLASLARERRQSSGPRATHCRSRRKTWRQMALRRVPEMRNADFACCPDPSCEGPQRGISIIAVICLRRRWVRLQGAAAGVVRPGPANTQAINGGTDHQAASSSAGRRTFRKTSRSMLAATSGQRASSKAQIVGRHREGMPRCFHIATLFCFMLNIREILPVPPSASISSKVAITKTFT